MILISNYTMYLILNSSYMYLQYSNLIEDGVFVFLVYVGL